MMIVRMSLDRAKLQYPMKNTNITWDDAEGLRPVAHSEVVAKHPGKNFDSLSKGEWQTIDEKINARFRELLISEFPDKHYQLNLLYLSKKQGDFKPP